MFRARELRVLLAQTFLLAGTLLGPAAADAIAQESAETSEDFGNAYMLARRTTVQGSIIETLLYAGRPIVTEIVMPGAGSAEGAGAESGAALPPGVRPGFGGTLLSAEAAGPYLVLHRRRASGPVAHDVFRDGEKVGTVVEVPAVRAGTASGRNLFAFEAAGDRFIVHLTQPDGTKIRATSVHGELSDTVVEAAAAAPSPAAAAPARPSAKPQNAAGGEAARKDTVGKDAVGSVAASGRAVEVVPAPVPKFARARTAIAAPRPPARPAAQPASAALGFFGSAPAPAASTPAPDPKSTVTRVNARAQRVATAKPVTPAARAPRPAAAPGAQGAR